MSIAGGRTLKNYTRMRLTNLEPWINPSTPLCESASHLMVSRKYPNSERLRRRFNLALLRIKEKGT